MSGLPGPPASWARRLGVSRQAVGKAVDRLEELSYAGRPRTRPTAGGKLVRLTPCGVDAFVQSALIFDDLRAQWDGVTASSLFSTLLGDAVMSVQTVHGSIAGPWTPLPWSGQAASDPWRPYARYCYWNP